MSTPPPPHGNDPYPPYQPPPQPPATQPPLTPCVPPAPGYAQGPYTQPGRLICGGIGILIGAIFIVAEIIFFGLSLFPLAPGTGD
ncbi:MAG: hypothetical protein J2P40_06365 [Candidatus Dormibacteraeota bacterium]|nr:hypothetical protein [Candidatus Dormibacteraeota bacterium]MBO0760880.1 hypothetical protein [Candidatus Dormibacteraeota bacterium]